jgi:hypothetical protein
MLFNRNLRLNSKFDKFDFKIVCQTVIFLQTYMHTIIGTSLYAFFRTSYPQQLVCLRCFNTHAKFICAGHTDNPTYELAAVVAGLFSVGLLLLCRAVTIGEPNFYAGAHGSTK